MTFSWTNEFQLFPHFGEEGLAGADFLFVAESQLNTLTQECVGETAVAALARARRCIGLFDILREFVAQFVNLNFQLGQ